MIYNTLLSAALAVLLHGDTASACSACSEPTLAVRSTKDKGPRGNASGLVRDAIDALGGRSVLNSLSGITYESADIFRVNTLMQNYDLFHTDRYVVSKGSQNISYSILNGSFAQRIDRTYQLSDYFYFANPSIPEAHFSLTMRNGRDGYACYIDGNNAAFSGPDVTTGYTDSSLAEYLLFQAQKMSPTLLLDVEGHRLTQTSAEINGVRLPAVHDKNLNLDIIFDSDTHLPYVIRSFEDHGIFGPTTSDIHLFNYTIVDGLQVPSRRLVIYNGTAIVEDTTFSKVAVNPQFPQTFFDGLPQSESATPRVAPKKIAEYSHAEIGEYWSNTLWTGRYTGTFANLTADTPAKDLPKAHRVLVTDSPNVEQLVLEFDDSIIVYEAPPHQTDLIIRWVQQTLRKPITHVYPTHHHHDHNYDIYKYVALGAKIISPEISAPYWKQIPGAQLVTYSEGKPYIHSDSKMQARFIWQNEPVHSIDWSYSIVTARCPTANNSMLSYVADAWSTSVNFDDTFAQGWLGQAVRDGMSRDTIVIPAHGQPTSLSVLLKQLDYKYPDLDATSFRTGGNICLL